MKEYDVIGETNNVLDNINYYLLGAEYENIDLIKEYKLKSILDYAKDLSDIDIEAIKNYVNESVRLYINSYQLIKVDDIIIGCLYIKEHDDGVLLDEIYIEESYRSHGIGSSIIKSIIRLNNIVYLWVYKNNIIAIKLYKKLGFYVISETDTRLYMKYVRE